MLSLFIFQLAVSVSASSFDQPTTTSFIPIKNSIYDPCTTNPLGYHPSDFGCGAGLVCKPLNNWYSQCLPDPSLLLSLWKTCTFAPSLCPAGGGCIGNQWYKQCMACRSTAETCGSSAFISNAVSCCPGLECTTVTAIVDGLVGSKQICLPSGSLQKRIVVNYCYNNCQRFFGGQVAKQL